MENTLTNTTYVITGATSGIGRAIAGQLAHRGANVIGIGRSTERCWVAEHELRAQHPTTFVKYLAADLSLQSQVRRTTKKI